MPASIGVNLRVTGHCSQGGRKYMEDLFSVAYQQTEDERDLEYAFFGIYDGHGGGEAAAFAKEHLMDSIVKQRQFWSDNDEDVLKAIRNGYMLTHMNMWKEVEKWPKTVTGLPSTAGTTASVAFIRRGKIYIGHVGDSAIVLGYQKDGSEEWAAKPLTLDHKPESTAEMERIQKCGGKVVSKAGVPRVVWNKPRLGHKGPIKKNTPMDEIPFLAVARSLGDLWSYNPQNDEFIVSPDPDVGVLTIDPSKFRCLIFGTDGLWNMISPEGAVHLVQITERHNEAALVGGNANQPRDWLNPSKSLVDHALERWSNTRMRADNTSVVTLMLDPPGPPRATVLRSRTTPGQKPNTAALTPTVPMSKIGVPTLSSKVAEPKAGVSPDDTKNVPQNGLTIMTRYSDVDKPVSSAEETEKAPLPPCATLDGRFSVGHKEDDNSNNDSEVISNYGNPAESYFMARLLNRTRIINTLSEVYDEIINGNRPKVQSKSSQPSPPTTIKLPVKGSGDGAGRAPSSVPSTPRTSGGAGGEAVRGPDEVGIQINEVSSSSPTEGTPRARGRRYRRESRRDAPPVTNDRVLRSHHEVEAPHRPQTRLVTTRTRPPGDAAPLDRIVILNRRGNRSASPPGRAAPATPRQTPRRAYGENADGVMEEARRSTRSQAAAATPAPRACRDVKSGGAAGNSPRAPGPVRRAPAARGRSKENLGVARRPARACAAPVSPSPPSRPPPPPRQRRADNGSHELPEVHSTTSEAAAAACPERALRSRNEPAAPCSRAGGKRRAAEEASAGVAKVARVSIGKRATSPWVPAPAHALRNRLRRRFVK